MTTTTWNADEAHWKASFGAIYDAAVEKYDAGDRGAETFFNDEQQAFLAAIGYTPQELYDFAEDAVNYGEPDAATALAVAEVRREYFLTVQKGQSTGKTLSMESLPAKTEEVEGIDWLPRLIPKALAKLRGEMPADLMYGCGGDRRFFKEHQIEPAAFLRHVWEVDGERAKIIAYVKERSPVTA